ncbi:hypothetical protein LUZ60_008083 [Juncus effusus]|nr:hypothetical protein LUZ60_008083 [Juncus effusus]
MEPAFFPVSSLFGSESDNEEENGKETTEEQNNQLFVERNHVFPQMELKIREFSFHYLNANLLWPGTFSFAEWLVENQSFLRAQRILELGSGTGALAIFLRKSFGVDITTSDYDDPEIEENIAYNCEVNGFDPLPHIRHTWGEPFPTSEPDWDLIIASDILLYVKQYANLVKTLSFLLGAYKPRHKESNMRKRSICIPGKQVELQMPIFLMSWRRRIGKEDEQLFFNSCERAGLASIHIGSRIYCISSRPN